MLQLGDEEDQYIIDCRDSDIRDFKSLLENPDILFVGHNIKFDYNMLKQYDIVLNKVYDTMVAEQCIYNGKYGMLEIIKTKRYSLQGVYRHYFKKKIDKDTRQEFLSVFNRPFTEKQLNYGINDAIFPLEIKQEQEKLISLYDLTDYVRLENKVVLALGDMEYNGILVDSNKWLEVIKKTPENIKNTIIDLDTLLLEQPDTNKYILDAKQLSLFGPIINDRISTVNWRSNHQVLSILKEIFNINPVDKHGKNSSGKSALDILDPFKNIPFVKLILKHRQEEKILSSFGKSYLNKYIDFDGKIRTTFNQVVSTGRVSSRNPNLQQVPKTKEYRSCFMASPDYKIAAADYNSQESRIMASFSKDPTMIEFFKTGDGDLHSFVATKVFSTKFKKEFIVTSTNENKSYRQFGKILNFSIAYGAGAYSIALNNGITEAEAQELIDLFYTAFPNLKPLFENAKKFGIENGYIITNNLVRSRRWFPEWIDYKKLVIKRNLTLDERKQIMKIKGSIERRSQNAIIQGSAGIMTKLAMVLIREAFIKEGIRPLKNAEVKLLLTIHDELLIEAKADLIEKYAIIQKDCMEKAGGYICTELESIATSEIGDFWIH